MTNIQKTNKTLKERGLHNRSVFSVDFHDKTSCSEHDTSWIDISERKEVTYFGMKKVVHVCKHSVKKISVTHEGLSTFIDVPHGCEVYQSIRAETVFLPTGEKVDQILGRIIGIVKDGEVIEEHFINGLNKKIEGLKK